MKTNNIISTPDITGNIGSCTSQAQLVITNSGLFRETGYTVVTNSCTGVATTTNYSALEGITVIGCFVLIALFLIGWITNA